MSRDINAEMKAIAEMDEAAFPAMTYYAVMRFDPVAALKDLGFDGDSDGMKEAAELQKRLSNHLVYIVVSFDHAHIRVVLY